MFDPTTCSEITLTERRLSEEVLSSWAGVNYPGEHLCDDHRRHWYLLLLIALWPLPLHLQGKMAGRQTDALLSSSKALLRPLRPTSAFTYEICSP
jgi:hypothetical protein